MTEPDRSGRSTFTIEGRTAPGLYVVGWLATILGLVTTAASLLSPGGPIATAVFLAGLVVLDVGLIAGAGSQAIERRTRGTERYQGPSPILVLLVSIATVYVVAFLVGLPLEASGISLSGPARQLLLVAIQVAVYLAITRLLVVGTGALSWADMGFAGPVRRGLAEAAWGAVLAGPVILATAVLSSILVAVFKSTPASVLPPTGTPTGLLLNLLAGAVVAPIGEEIIFRGVATTAWVRALGARAGIVRAALLFAAVHVLLVSSDSFGAAAGLVVVGFVGRLPVAVVLGWVYVRRGSIWAPIGLHAAFNAVLIVVAELAAVPPG